MDMVNKIYSGLVLLVVLFFIVFEDLDFMGYGTSRRNKEYVNDIMQLQLHGVVAYKYIDYEDHAAGKYVFADSSKARINYNGIWEAIEAKDSIVKDLNTNKIYIYRGDTMLVHVFPTERYGG
jgi:hypothetical protein